MNIINGKTKIIGIIGYPIEHTLSPLMHNTAFKYCGLNFVYVPFSVNPKFIKSAINGVKSLNIYGLNVTIPHKETVIKYLDKIDNIAKKIGAVNTITNYNNVITGYNTDAFGFLRSLEQKINPDNKTIFLYGAGGVAKAIGYVLLTKRINKIYITDINEIKAKQLCKKLGKSSIFINYDKGLIKETVRKSDIFINASPIGMKNGDPSILESDSIHSNLFIYDVVYNRETELIKLAKQKKLEYCDGIDMFVYQGAVAFEYWTKTEAPIKIMYAVIKERR
jgi:shikimate dehydrogenase